MRRVAHRGIHPGEVLADDLEALEMSAAELSRQIKVPTNRITAILKGQRAVTGDTALRLGHFFGTSAEFWLSGSLLRTPEMRSHRPCRSWLVVTGANMQDG
jgi:addiction module HigA family antidote